MALNKRQKQYVADYVREVMDILHLKDWEAKVHFEKPKLEPVGDDIAAAQAAVALHRKVVDIVLDDDVLDFTDGEDIRQTVAHEVLHCHGGPMWNWVRIQLLDCGDVSQSFYDLFVAGVNQNMEYMIDGIADAIAPFLPAFKLP